MIIDEIVLGAELKSKITAINEMVEKEIMVKDDHGDWCHGKVLSSSGDDKIGYVLEIRDGRGKRTLMYHDIKQLLSVKESGIFYA